MRKSLAFWVPIGALAGVVATLAVNALDTCPVHGVKLMAGTAPVEYGLKSAIFLAGPDRKRFFPRLRSESFIDGGCVPCDDRTEQVWYCQRCREAEAAWLLARGRWLNDIQRDAATHAGEAVQSMQSN